MVKRSFIVGVAVMFALVLAAQGWAEEADEAAKTEEVEKININTATAKELAKLKRIGPKYAERIIEYREQTPFEKPEDIMKVRGVGKKTFEANKDVIVVE